jgi:hypothetical protein
VGFWKSSSLSLPLSHRGKSNLSFYNPNCDNSKSVQADPIFLAITQNWETSTNDSFQQPLLPPPFPRKEDFYNQFFAGSRGIREPTKSSAREFVFFPSFQNPSIILEDVLTKKNFTIK